MRGPIVLPALVLLAAGCAAGPGGTPAADHRSDAVPGSDVACIHRLWDLPDRTMPFAAAAETCAHGRGRDGTPDLTGSPYFQVLARSANIAFTTRDGQPGSIALVGTRIARPVTEPAPPDTVLR